MLQKIPELSQIRRPLALQPLPFWNGMAFEPYYGMKYILYIIGLVELVIWASCLFLSVP